LWRGRDNREKQASIGRERVTTAERTRDAEPGIESHQPAIQITLPQTLIIRILSVLIIAFVVAHMVFSINRYMIHGSFFAADNLYVVFDLWAESSIPSWYSVALLLACAALLGVIAVAKRRAADRFARHWLGLALIFLALSIDDAADLHGHTSYKLQEMFETGGFLAYAWVIPAGIACAVVGLAYLRFLVELPPAIRWRFVIGGVLFLTGALVMEMIEGRYDTQHGVENMPYRIMVAIEESLEMAGIVIFISALMTYLSGLGEKVEFRIRP
jgi:hypothetical protein